MRFVKIALTGSAAALMLAGCATDAGVFGRATDGQAAVTRMPPLVIPPDFGMAPPRAGETGTVVTEAGAQQLRAQLGGQAQTSPGEQALLRQAEAERAVPGARSAAGETETRVVEKGIVTRTILLLPEGDGREASVSVPQ